MALIERSELVARIGAARAAAAQGRGSIIAVSGEAGAGKTSLVRAALPDRTAAWGFCEPLATPRPLGPFRDLTAAVWGSDSRGDRDGDLRDALLDWMRGEPVPLVIEDAHWIDAASAELLRFLGRRIEFSRGLVVVTYRDELTPSHPLRSLLGDLASARAVERIEVGPLSAGAVMELAGDDGAEIYRLTNGNAFLVVELLGGSGRRLSRSVQDQVLARLSALGAPARELVELLSVMPGRVERRLIADAWTHLDETIVAGILEYDDPYVRFHHELVRLAVAGALSPARASGRHAEVLRRLDDLDDAEPAVVAFHARRAHDRPRAFAADRAAGEQALETGSPVEAAGHFGRASEQAPTGVGPGALVEIRLRLAEAEFVAGRSEAALAAAQLALDSCPAGEVRLRGMALGWLSRTTAAETAAHAYARQAVELLEPLGPSAELAGAYAQLALDRMVARELPEAAQLGAVAIDLSERMGDTASLVRALQAAGCADVLAGTDSGPDPGSVVGVGRLRRAVELARGTHQHRLLGQAYANLVSATGEARLYEQSAVAAEEALAYFLSRDLDFYADYTRAWQARCLFEQGRWSAATVCVDAILAGPTPATGITAIVALTVRGRIRARRGDPDVWAALDEAKRIADATGSLQRLAPVAAARAEARFLAGQSDDGQTGLAAAYGLALERSNGGAAGELGLWLARHGLLPGTPVSASSQSSAAEPYRLQLAGRSEAAGQAWLRLGCPYEAADAWSESADPDVVRRALDLFTELGAAPGRQRAAQQLRRLGVRTIPRGPRAAAAADPDGLTGREQEVLSWVLGGYTDSEIAARLHLSAKTVEHHVSAILRKTGSPSRRELQRRREAGPI